MDSRDRDLLNEVYRAFNARDIAAVLAHLHPAVEWANGMEGGYVRGHDGVRAYWTRQWGLIDPHVEPRAFREEGGRIAVEVHQVIRDRAGAVLREQVVQHIYTIENGLIRRMEIAKS